MRVLVVDDDEELLELVEHALAKDGHEVAAVVSGEQALQRIPCFGPDLVVLDLGLPGISGEEVCRSLRSEGIGIPILVLTAQSAVASRVRCLDDGADDYLSKPFAVAELRARVRALGRRAGRGKRPTSWSSGVVTLDFLRRRAFVAGQEAPLTAREWSILEVLAVHPGNVVGRAELLHGCGSEPSRASGASLEVLIGRIRRKLGEGLVRTLRGEGYALAGAGQQALEPALPGAALDLGQGERSAPPAGGAAGGRT